MNKRNILIGTTLAIIITAIITTFVALKPNSADYTCAIPKNVQMVATFDLASIIKKTGIDTQDANNKSITTLAGILTKYGLGNNTKFLEHPEEMGIDINQKVFIFSTPDKSLCLLAKIANKKQALDFMTALSEDDICEKPIEKKDIYWTKILGELPTAVNDQTIIMMLPSEKIQNPEDDITKMLQQKEDDCFINTAKGQELIQADGDISMTAILSALAESPTPFTELLPKGVRASEVELHTSILFLEGKMVMNTKIVSQNKKMQELLNEINENTQKINRLYIPISSKNLRLWASAGINGEWLLKQMKKNKDIKQYLFLLERAIDIEKMIKSINGDIMIALPSPSKEENKYEIPYVVTAQTKSQDFLNDIDYWTTSMKEYGMTMVATTENMYKLTAEDNIFYWGTNPYELYFTSSPSLIADKQSNKETNVITALEQEIKNSRFYLYINVEQMNQDGICNDLDGIPMFSLLPHTIEDICISADNANNLKTTFRMKEKNTNALKTIINNVLGY